MVQLYVQFDEYTDMAAFCSYKLAVKNVLHILARSIQYEL